MVMQVTVMDSSTKEMLVIPEVQGVVATMAVETLTYLLKLSRTHLFSNTKNII